MPWVFKFPVSKYIELAEKSNEDLHKIYYSWFEEDENKEKQLKGNFVYFKLKSYE